MILEICCSNIESVIAAREGGASRVELCSALETGGVTPSEGFIRKAVELFPGPVVVLIRPRSGDYVYSSEEIDIMVDDIHTSIATGADGVVVGALDKEGNIDTAACKRFVEAADGHTVVFHRAFDMVSDPLAALQTLVNLGFNRILTSGCKPTVTEGCPTLVQLNKAAHGRITIMPGGGVTAANASAILAATGCREIHASAKTMKNAAGEHGSRTDIDASYAVSSPSIIKEIKAAIK